MKSSFDKELRQKLEGIKPEDAGLSFDREKVWRQISQPHKKVLPLRAWLTHAAAVVMGILIAGYFFSRRDNPPMSPTAVTQKKILAKPETVSETPDSMIAVANPSSAGIKHNLRQTPAESPAGHPKPETANTRPDTALVYQQPPAVIEESVAQVLPPPKQSPKVLHLADMNNENSAHRYAESKPESLLTRLAGKEEAKETETEMLSALISNYVTNKKFK